MIVQHNPPLHLAYCQNIHRGESWTENFAAIRERTVAVKQQVASDQWFGMGLRLGHHAVNQLLGDPALIDEAREFFAEHQLYPFSINGFPYGRFHQGTVKENVYAPDWRSPERRDYTMQLADVFAQFLPPSVDGSISTVPGSFRPWIESDNDKITMAKNLAAVVAYFAAVRDDTGQEIHLGLEPEPDCFLETTGDTIVYYEDFLLRSGLDELQRIVGCSRPQAEEIMRRHLGICFDTCHIALAFEDLVESWRAYRGAGIRISKVQLSAALHAESSPESWEALKRFVEPVYLHQVKGLGRSGARFAWFDLPDALAEFPSFPDLEYLRVHFHVPLFFLGAGPLQSTSAELTPEFFQELRTGVCSHLEIETYTFHVLPSDVYPGDIVRSLTKEYAWVLQRLEGRP